MSKPDTCGETGPRLRGIRSVTEAMDGAAEELRAALRVAGIDAEGIAWHMAETAGGEVCRFSLGDGNLAAVRKLARVLRAARR
ncbi:hypothetical protein [Streptomyces sp. NPDC059080]|uniref:hypothetical protein n=1 Tax=Streptomyces sp. NPDC059080 TaxID=3346718 RepID=UPI0036BB8D61